MLQKEAGVKDEIEEDNEHKELVLLVWVLDMGSYWDITSIKVVENLDVVGQFIV